MNETMSEPTTEAGRRYLDRIAPLSASGIAEHRAAAIGRRDQTAAAILAIEAEARVQGDCPHCGILLAAHLCPKCDDCGEHMDYHLCPI